MTNSEKLAIAKDRLTKLEHNPKNIKSHGVIRKLKRQIRLLGNKVEDTE